MIVSIVIIGSVIVTRRILGGSSLLFCFFNMVVMVQLDKHPEVLVPVVLW